MKKFQLTTALCALCLMFTSCGGGGSKNDYLGSLPGLYEKYNKAETEMQASVEGELDMAKLTKVFAELKAREDKLKAAVAAELETLVGKAIPVSYSDALVASGKIFYDAAATVNSNRGSACLSMALSAKDDYTVPAYGRYDKQYMVYYHFIDRDGASIEGSKWSFTPVAFDKAGLAFPKGTELWSDETARTFDVDEYPEAYAAFAGVQFITAEEYDAL